MINWQTKAMQIFCIAFRYLVMRTLSKGVE